jgi:glycosyltransferase involved in cell wall biosynthesis
VRLLLHVFPTFAVGGAQMRFVALANHFGSRYRHIVIALDGRIECRERLRPEIDVVFPAMPAAAGGAAGAIRRARTLLRDMRPDLLVTSNWGAIDWVIANLLPITPHVHMEDGFGPEERARQLSRRVWTRRLVLRRSLVVLPSQTLWRLATQSWRLDQRRLRYVPNGIDLQRFAPPRRGADHSTAEVPLTIGTVAALRAEKNLARLLRAFRGAVNARAAREPPLRLVVAGDGPERGALQRLTEELGLGAAVYFAGHLTEPASFYQDLDLFALSSDTEQMPLSVLEAMAAGLPVVATDVGDIRAMLAPANGAFVVPAADEALADALRLALRDEGRRRAIGVANRSKAERNYGQEEMFRAYGEIFDGRDAASARAAPTHPAA